MRTERLTVFVSPQEKARIASWARAHGTSISKLVRSALAAVGEQLPDRERGNRDEPLSAEQMALLERFAVVAMGSMRRANHALDRAFEAADATKAHLAKTKRMRASVAG